MKEELLHKVWLRQVFCFKQIKKSDIYIICVPTPIKDDKSDLSFCMIIDKIQVIENNSLVIIESTIPIGTTRKCKDLLSSKRNDIDKSKIYFAHCPERVLPGNAINEIINNHRVIGGIDPKSTNKAKSIYEKFCLGEIFETTSETAEMIKLSENTFRDVNIGLANELSIIAEDENINISDVINIANKHPRVNIQILNWVGAIAFL